VTTEEWLGAALTLGWALVVIWSLGRIVVRAWPTLGFGNVDHLWDYRSFWAGLLVGAALAGGAILFVEPNVVLFGTVHTIGLGFVLAVVATFFLFVFAKEGSL
jgi:hypothetical protein